MNFAQDIDDYIYQIHGFSNNGIEIAVPSGRNELKTPLIDGIATLQQSFIISPSQLIEEWQVTKVGDLIQEAVTTPLLALDIEILILGTGEMLTFPDTSLLTPFIKKAVGVEVMDSRAACRTYNLLSGEGRRVAAAIIL